MNYNNRHKNRKKIKIKNKIVVNTHINDLIVQTNQWH